MKLVYRFNSSNIFTSTDIVEEDYQLKANETFVAVPQGSREPVRWTGSTWQQATPEENAEFLKKQREAMLAEHPELAQQSKPAGPSAQDQLNAQTSLQLAQLLASKKQQDQLNAKLTVDVAMLKKQLQTADK